MARKYNVTLTEEQLQTICEMCADKISELHTIAITYDIRDREAEAKYKDVYKLMQEVQ